jgi:hypothetical protein
LDPLVRGMDPGIRIRIRNKMSRIPYTGLRFVLKTLELCLFAVLHHGLRGPGGHVHSAALPPAGQGSPVRKWMVDEI